MTKLNYTPIILAVKKRTGYKAIGSLFEQDSHWRTILESLQNRVTTRYQALKLVKNGSIFSDYGLASLAEEVKTKSIYIFDVKWELNPFPFNQLNGKQA